MATIAKAMITLTNVNDAYSVVLSPDSCVIKADFDGTNPNLDAAFTDITVVRGETKHTYKLEVSAISNSAITYQLGSIDAYTKRVKLTNIPFDILSGYISFTVSTEDEYVATVTFQYSVVRETSMLDWILDWENNKTKIGDSYLITPKLFVGKKVENEEGLKKLTGIYIGPDTVNTAGIYGYKEGEDVFHINAIGAMIGGWEINKAGIITSNQFGYVKLLSDGNLSFSNLEGDVVWKLYSNGDATFAQGNVSFDSDGNASFSGEISAASGDIASWNITKNALCNDYVRLDSESRLIGVVGHQSSVDNGADFIEAIKQYGGVYMNYKASGNYGLHGYLPGVSKNGEWEYKETFALGIENKIANWYFDNTSLYMGTKVNMTTKYTNQAKDITIGSNGLRGYSWYIDNTGDVSFAKGLVKLNGQGGELVGWSLQTNRLSSNFSSIVSDPALTGLYLSVDVDVKNTASSNLKSEIQKKGGIFLCTDGVTAELYASDSTKNKVFYLTTHPDKVSQISNWHFNKDALYSGEMCLSGFTKNSGDITIGGDGIRGYKWRLESDGSAVFCGGNATLNANGSGNFSNGNIKWNADGSGSLAAGNISWDKDGVLTFTNSVVLSWSKPYIDAANDAADSAASAASDASSSASSAASAASDASSSASSAASAADSAEKAAAIAAAVGADVDKKYADLIGTKLTYIDANGIYTGTLVADQVSGLACTFVKGTIGGWDINKDSISSNSVQLRSDGQIFNSGYWSLNADGSGFLAAGNVTWDKAGSISMKGKITATSGSIGGFEIGNGYLGLSNGVDGGTNGMYLHDNMIGFNGAKRQAIIGVCQFLGSDSLGRFYDNKQDLLDRHGLSISVTGSCSNNVALSFGGGYISGINLKTKSYAFDHVYQSYSNGKKTDPPTRLDIYIDRDVNCVAVSTQYYWHPLNSDKVETKTRDVYVHFPDMKQYDDGHVLYIKRIVNSGSTVYLVPSKSYRLTSDGYSFSENSYNSCINANGNDWYTQESNLAIASEGDAMQFIYFRDLTHSVTANSVTTSYNGVWIQWKNPRDW